MKNRIEIPYDKDFVKEFIMLTESLREYCRINDVHFFWKESHPYGCFINHNNEFVFEDDEFGLNDILKV